MYLELKSDQQLYTKLCTQMASRFIIYIEKCEVCMYRLFVTVSHQGGSRVFDKNFCSVPNWVKNYKPPMPQSTMMGRSCGISIKGLNHVAPKWSNRSSKVVFSLGH